MPSFSPTEVAKAKTLHFSSPDVSPSDKGPTPYIALPSAETWSQYKFLLLLTYHSYHLVQRHLSLSHHQYSVH